MNCCPVILSVFRLFFYPCICALLGDGQIKFVAGRTTLTPAAAEVKRSPRLLLSTETFEVAREMTDARSLLPPCMIGCRSSVIDASRWRCSPSPTDGRMRQSFEAAERSLSLLGGSRAPPPPPPPRGSPRPAAADDLSSH